MSEEKENEKMAFEVKEIKSTLPTFTVDEMEAPMPNAIEPRSKEETKNEKKVFLTGAGLSGISIDLTTLSTSVRQALIEGVLKAQFDSILEKACVLFLNSNEKLSTNYGGISIREGKTKTIGALQIREEDDDE